MSGHDALLAAILADPAADLPRLAYADWIEQYRQDVGRAEFIRVQVELGSRVGTKQPLTIRTAHLYATGQAKATTLADRAANLLSEYATLWCSQIGVDPAVALQWGWHRGFMHTILAPFPVLYGGECDRCNQGMVTYEEPIYGGFSSQSCSTCRSTGRTPGILPRLVREQPIEVVKVTDREPYLRITGGYWWNVGHSTLSHLPIDLIERMIRPMWPNGWVAFPTREAAEKALSDAFIKWAKQQEIK
jgi:uncharacterized protein (TIGR02996 family)